MAKKTTAVATRKTGSGVATKAPAYLAKQKMSGKGVSTDASDNLIPMVRILQALSPEVNKKLTTKYIDGAEPGDIYVKNSPDPIIKADEGFLFQPCFFYKGVVEWTPRSKGGGFVKLHPSMPDDAMQAPDPQNEEKTITIRKSNKNLLVETRYFGGFIVSEDNSEAPAPVVIPFASSGHTVAKAWNMLMNKKQVDGAKADMWAVYYRFKSVSKTVGENTWNLFDISDAGEDGETLWAPTEEDFKRGSALHDAMSSGQKTFNAGDAHEEEETGGNKGRM